MFQVRSPRSARYTVPFAAAQLWWLLDIASADEPDRSEQRASVRELESLNPRQLESVVVRVALATVVVSLVVVWVRKWLTRSSQFGGITANGVGGQLFVRGTWRG